MRIQFWYRTAITFGATRHRLAVAVFALGRGRVFRRHEYDQAIVALTYAKNRPMTERDTFKIYQPTNEHLDNLGTT